MNFPIQYCVALTLSMALLAGCTVGPNYTKPEMATPEHFKEAAGWKLAEPNDDAIPQKWWELFNDETLNNLETQVAVSNQNLRAAEARFRQAKALSASYRSEYFPTISGTASHTRNQPSGNSTNSINGAKIRDTNNLSFSFNWEADVWGRISRTVEAGDASLQASAGDIAAALLSAQAELAQNYFALRVADSQKQLLEETVKSYQKSLHMTRNRYEAGVVGKADVIQAETQLKSTEVQLKDVGIQRAQFEHAIAVLIGKAPSELIIARASFNLALPDIPVSMPSTLLERRPDIAAAERRVAAANAQIGVAKAAFYPALSISAVAGFQSNTIENLLSWPSRIWSLGSTLAMTVFDAGKRQALTDQAVASYDENVANYRQTVLTGFQEVEDNLAALKILQDEVGLQAEALDSARLSLNYANNQYKAGVLNYLDVITVSNIALSNERDWVNLRGRQVASSVLLIKALGGGWKTQQ